MMSDVSTASAVPAPTTRTVAVPRWASHTLPVLVGLVAAVVAWLRLPAGARDTLWAEDSALFLQQRLQLGPFASLVHPYDGYQHLVPRLLTDVATALPVADYARAVTALCCIVVGLVAAATVAFSRAVLPNPVTRSLFALVPVLTPVVAFEVLGNTANLHSFLLFLVPVVLLVRPRTWGGAVAPGVVALVVALSEIQSVYFLPLVLLTVRHRRAWPVAGGLLVGLALQFASVLSSPRVRPPFHQGLGDVVTGWFVEPVLSVLYPKASSAADRLGEYGLVLPVLLAVGFVAATAVVLVGRWRRGDGLGPLRTLAITLVVASPLAWAAGVLLNPTPLIDFSEGGLGALGRTGYLRYAAASSMFLVALVVLAADRLLRTGRRPLVVVAVLVLVGWVAFLGWRATPYDVARSGAPTWTSAVRDGRQQCDGGVQDTRLQQAPTGWGVTLRCTTIRTDAFPEHQP